MLAEEAVLSMRIDSVENPPWGIAGGMAGGTGRAVVNPGTRTSACWRRCRTATCCGAATSCARDRRRRRLRPSVRPPGRAVLEDVRGGFVSAEAARRDYGVAIAGDALDECDAHARHRKASASACGAVGRGGR